MREWVGTTGLGVGRRVDTSSLYGCRKQQTSGALIGIGMLVLLITMPCAVQQLPAGAKASRDDEAYQSLSVGHTK